jgi:glycerol-3-phosphate dehydrogenase
MRAGLFLDRLVAFDRNRGVPASHQLPAGRVEADHAVWYDYVTAEADRLTFSFALAAWKHGAVLANHIEATSLVAEGPRVTAVRARDRLGGRELEIAARVIVNAMGGSVDRLLEPIGAATAIPMFRTMNLVTRREGGDCARGARSPATGRTLFQVPWRGRALFGTWESPTLCRSTEATINELEVAGFIRDLNEAFPTLGLTLDDVALVHRGIVPAVAANGGFALEGHEQVRDHANEGARRFEGLVSVVGAKYTTARGVAERVTDRLLAKLHRAPVPCMTATTPLPGAGLADLGEAARAAQRAAPGAPHDTIDHLVAAYGSKYTDILELCADQPALQARFSQDSPVIEAEVVWAARCEMAVTLADAVLRRTPLGALGHPGERAVERAASLVAAELGWSPDRTPAEIAALEAFFPARAG